MICPCSVGWMSMEGVWLNWRVRFSVVIVARKVLERSSCRGRVMMPLIALGKLISRGSCGCGVPYMKRPFSVVMCAFVYVLMFSV